MSDRRIILILKNNNGIKHDEIALENNRDRGSVFGVLKNLLKQRVNPRSSRQLKLFDKDKQNILNKAYAGHLSARNIES